MMSERRMLSEADLKEPTILLMESTSENVSVTSFDRFDSLDARSAYAEISTTDLARSDNFSTVSVMMYESDWSLIEEESLLIVSEKLEPSTKDLTKLMSRAGAASV